MKNHFISFIILLLFGCSQNNNNTEESNSKGKEIVGNDFKSKKAATDGDIIFFIPIENDKWVKEVQIFDPLKPYEKGTTILDSKDGSIVKKDQLIIENHPDKDRNIRYIYTYYLPISEIKNRNPKYLSVGYHINLGKTNIMKGANAFVSLLSTEEIKSEESNGIIKEYNKWYDYEIQDDKFICPDNSPNCRYGNRSIKYPRERNCPVAVGAKYDMKVFKNKIIKIQFMLEVEKNSTGKSKFEIQSVQFHLYKDKEEDLGKDLEICTQNLNEVVDNGQSGPRPPRNNQ